MARAVRRAEGGPITGEERGRASVLPTVLPREAPDRGSRAKREAGGTARDQEDATRKTRPREETRRDQEESRESHRGRGSGRRPRLEPAIDRPSCGARILRCSDTAVLGWRGANRRVRDATMSLAPVVGRASVSPAGRNGWCHPRASPVLRSRNGRGPGRRSFERRPDAAPHPVAERARRRRSRDPTGQLARRE